MAKQIDYILEGREKKIAEDETVLQPLPHRDFRFASPFIVLHHLIPKHFAPGSPPARIHPHPHRGFAPVTFMLQGEGFHKDSAGNGGILKTGSVQWMFAGSGLLHSEGPTKELLEKGGAYELIQLWVNVPSGNKLDKPFYQEATKEKMPSLFEEDGIDLRLASGNYHSFTGPLKSITPVVTVFGTAAKDKIFSIATPEGYWTLLYVAEGSVIIDNDKEVTAHRLVVFSKEETDFSITTKEDSKLLYLSAEPINENVAAKGNFVMNTPEEVQKAEKDYAEGKFGELKY